jgi:CO/xanthine dehydrogenase Mo-binding subunit
VAVNRAGVAKQIEGGLLFGLSAALFGQITPGPDGVQQSNFHQYRLLRMNEAPALHVEVITTGRPLLGGIGECATSAVMPCVANAVSDLVGHRVRSLPLAQG